MKAFLDWLLGYGSPRTAALLRVSLGIIAQANFILMVADVPLLFGADTPTPLGANRAYLGSDNAWVPHFNPLGPWQGDGVAWLLWGSGTVAAILTILGRWTRAATVVLALAVATMHHRNAIILMGGDGILRILLIYLALMDSGADLSWDRKLEAAKGLARRQIAVWPQRLMAYNVALLYFTTFWAKWFGTTWRDGTATWYPFHLTEFKRFPVPDAFLSETAVKVSTYGTLGVELALGILVWFRVVRPWILLLGAGMHLFIEYAMSIPLFAFTMIASYLAFYDGEDWEAFGRRVMGFVQGRRNVGPSSENGTVTSNEPAA